MPTSAYKNAGINTGDIVDQLEISCEPWDTADSLYSKILDAEDEVFVRHWPAFFAGKSVRNMQDPDGGSSHLRVTWASQISRELISTSRQRPEKYSRCCGR